MFALMEARDFGQAKTQVVADGSFAAFFSFIYMQTINCGGMLQLMLDIDISTRECALGGSGLNWQRFMFGELGQPSGKIIHKDKLRRLARL